GEGEGGVERGGGVGLGTTHGGRSRVADRRWKFRKASPDARIHISGSPRSDLKHFDRVRDRRSIELRQPSEIDAHERGIVAKAEFRIQNSEFRIQEWGLGAEVLTVNVCLHPAISKNGALGDGATIAK